MIAFFSALDSGLRRRPTSTATYTAADRRYVQVDAAIARESPLTAEEILARTREIEADEPPIIKAFWIFAYRQNLATHGQADHEPTIRPSWIQRLMLAVV